MDQRTVAAAAATRGGSTARSKHSEVPTAGSAGSLYTCDRHYAIKSGSDSNYVFEMLHMKRLCSRSKVGMWPSRVDRSAWQPLHGTVASSRYIVQSLFRFTWQYMAVDATSWHFPYTSACMTVYDYPSAHWGGLVAVVYTGGFDHGINDGAALLGVQTQRCRLHADIKMTSNCVHQDSGMHIL